MIRPLRPLRAAAFTTLVGLAGLVGFVGAEGCGETPPPVEAATACDATGITASMEKVAAADLAVHFDAPDEALLAPVRADFAKYTEALWGEAVPVAATAPDFTKPHTIWLSTSEEARTLTGFDRATGYALQRVEHRGSIVHVVYAKTPGDLAYGAYALLEELGARFFHPMDELIPKLDGPHLPKALDAAREPAFAVRGVHLHLLHPLEYFDAFNVPGDKNLADAKRFVDWMVKTGHNHLQWWILKTMDLEAWRPHAKAILDYAHGRGLTVGMVAQLWEGASLQNGYSLVTTEEGWQAQLEAGLDGLMKLSWDSVELGLGEFLGADPGQLVVWLNHATAYMADTYPGARLIVTNHVGNDEELWVEYEGQEVFYYHLPGFADERLVNDVHTVYFFDLYRDWACYGHPDFHLHRDFLMSQLPKRAMRYMPESAYWVAGDIDVPAFLPSYIYARWLDVHGLYADVRAAGLPMIEGHVMYSSGHEWGYWMTDYLAAKMLWEPEADFDRFLGHYASAFGTCAAPVQSSLSAFIDLQNQYLFDQRLVGYISGEDAQDDLGTLIGIETTPLRAPFEAVFAMDAAGRADFEAKVVAPLEAMAGAMTKVEDEAARACARPDATLAPWCAELVDGMAIVRIRAEHAAVLYRAVIGAAGGESDQGARLKRAAALTEAAKAVITRREKGYRFDVERLTGAYDNPTIYKFGYLRQAHTQCYFVRREEQVAYLVETGVAAPVTAIRNCLD